MKNLKMRLSIGRLSNGQIMITVEDEASSIQFLQLEMSPLEFGNAVTGLSLRPGVGVVNGLEYVGLKRVIEERKIECPLPGYPNREVLKNWLLENAQEPGWLIDSYLGSQNSVSYKDGKCVLCYRVLKYVDMAAHSMIEANKQGD